MPYTRGDYGIHLCLSTASFSFYSVVWYYIAQVIIIEWWATQWQNVLHWDSLYKMEWRGLSKLVIPLFLSSRAWSQPAIIQPQLIFNLEFWLKSSWTFELTIYPRSTLILLWFKVDDSMLNYLLNFKVESQLTKLHVFKGVLFKQYINLDSTSILSWINSLKIQPKFKVDSSFTLQLFI